MRPLLGPAAMVRMDVRASCAHLSAIEVGLYVAAPRTVFLAAGMELGRWRRLRILTRQGDRKPPNKDNTGSCLAYLICTQTRIHDRQGVSMRAITLLRCLLILALLQPALSALPLCRLQRISAAA